MTDPFSHLDVELDSPAEDGFAITPDATAPLPHGTCRAIYVGVTGNIALVTSRGSSVTFSNVPVGIFPVRAAAVRVSGTTATSLIALY